MDTDTIRVLLIEDDLDDVLLLKEALAQAGTVKIKITHADCLSKGLKRVAEQEFDVILLDLNLPDSRGLDTLSRLLRRASPIPIVVIGGLADDPTTFEAVRQGAQDYLVKGEISGPMLGRVLRYAIERKQAEQVLRESERSLKLIAENTRDTILAYDMQQRLIYVNPAVKELTGYGADELMERNFINWLHPDDEARMMQLWDGLYKGQGYVNQEFRIVTKSGQVKWCLGLWGALYDENGQQIGVQGSERDITERKRAEEALRMAESQLRSLFENVPDGVYRSTPEGKFFIVNPALVQMLGYASVEELLAIDLSSDLYTDPEARRVWAARLLQEGALRNVEIVMRRKDGQPLIELENTQVVRDERGIVLYFAGTLTDITERKRAEEHIETQLRRLASLHTIDIAISSSFNLRLVLNVVLEHTTAQLNMDAACVLLHNPHTQTLDYAAGRGFRTDALQHTRLRLGDGYAGRAALERQLIHITDLRGRKTDFLRSPHFFAEGFVAYYVVPLIAKGELKGVVEVFHRAPYEADDEWRAFLETLATQAALAIDNWQLFDNLQRSNTDLLLAYDTTIEGWSSALDLRDKETEGHTQRVTKQTVDLARLMGLSEDELVHIRRGALLHDIGKMGVPDSILLKPEKLTDEEWAIMQQHPQFAYDMLSRIAYLHHAMDIPYCHHEKWDGTGYPRGLKGEQIPFAARIFAVVDVWDALSSDRPYRAAWPRKKSVGLYS